MRLAFPFSDLLDLLLPRSCLGCGSRIPPEEGKGLVCLRCQTLLRPPPPPRCSRCDLPLGTGGLKGAPCLECRNWPGILSSARSAVVLEPPADLLVHALKYGGWRALAEPMGLRMAALLRPIPEGAVCVPVPTTPGRLRIRGYNQALLLAGVVASEAGIPLVEALTRPRGRSQVRLGPGRRKANVQDAFFPFPGTSSRIEGMEVILIDDVLTTGATVLSAAEVLRRMGAGMVRLITFARALPFAGRGRRQSLDPEPVGAGKPPPPHAVISARTPEN